MLSEESAHCEDGVWVMRSYGQPKQGNMTQIKKKWCVPDLQVGRRSFGISLNDLYSI